MPDLSRRNRWLQRLGDGMRRHAPVIRAVQWAVVVFYAVLLVTPTLLPLPAADGQPITDPHQQGQATGACPITGLSLIHI